MEKQKILAIKNYEEYICIKIKKQKSYYEFLFSLLDEFNEPIPDLYDEKGKLPNVFEISDKFEHYKGDEISIFEFIG